MIEKREASGMQRKTTMKRWLAAISLAILGGGMSACTSTSDISWKEEVQLSDGRVVVIEREVTLIGGASRPFLPEMGTGKFDEERIRFAISDGSGKDIEWRSTKRDYLTYPETPLVFELDSSSQPIILTIVGPVAATTPPCAKYSKYIFRNGVWTEEALPERFDQLATNLWLVRFPEKRYAPKLLTLAEKRKLNPTDECAPAFRQVGPSPSACGKAYIR
jgi:hypothetical protein